VRTFFGDVPDRFRTRDSGTFLALCPLLLVREFFLPLLTQLFPDYCCRRLSLPFFLRPLMHVPLPFQFPPGGEAIGLALFVPLPVFPPHNRPSPQKISFSIPFLPRSLIKPVSSPSEEDCPILFSGWSDSPFSYSDVTPPHPPPFVLPIPNCLNE